MAINYLKQGKDDQAIVESDAEVRDGRDHTGRHRKA